MADRALWGVHPIDFFETLSDTISAFMSAHKLVKAVFTQANRSGFHTSVTPVRHRRQAPVAKFDALGGGIIVGLSTGTIFLIRLILTN